MIPFPNVIAGIMIGIVNDVWVARLLAPFVWGIVFCIHTSIVRREELNAFVAWAYMSEKKNKWGMNHKQAFYFVENMTAVSTSLPLSIISGFVKGLF